MNNINFVNIDNNRIASAKQVYGVACHFARIDSTSPSERFGKQKVYHAILNKFYGDHDTKMTHGEVTDFFEHQEVPKVFLDLVNPIPTGITQIEYIIMNLNIRLVFVL